MSGEGVMLRVGPASRGQCGDEHGLQRDQDLAEGGLLHQPLQLLEVHSHAEAGAVAVHLPKTTARRQGLCSASHRDSHLYHHLHL